jgi:hypothetical protein
MEWLFAPTVTESSPKVLISGFVLDEIVVPNAILAAMLMLMITAVIINAPPTAVAASGRAGSSVKFSRASLRPSQTVVNPY